MQIVAELAQLDKLLEEGKTEEVLRTASDLLQHLEPSDETQRGELLAREAWAHYHRSEWASAHQVAQSAGNVRRARECLACLASYEKSPFRDDKALLDFALELNDSVSVTNALVIRARQATSLISHGSVLEIALRFRGTEVAVAHLFHNTARVFLDKARDDKDLVMALGFLEVALARYGTVANWHHRAAVNHYKSFCLQKILDQDGAVEAARQALQLWEQQVRQDSTNPSFKEKRDKARERVEQLEQ